MLLVPLVLLYDVPAFATLSRDIAAIGRRFYARHWVLGTSGNFSAVVRADPLRLAVTPSGAHKGKLSSSHLLEIDAQAKPVRGTRGTPSAEVALHLEIVRRRGAGAVLHTHSVWGTMLSDAHAGAGVLEIEGYEMLKGLSGVSTHEHREAIPVVRNDQDMTRLARAVGDMLERGPAVHAFLLQRHGLYTWGATLAEAERHVEILEFLFETIAQTAARK